MAEWDYKPVLGGRVYVRSRAETGCMTLEQRNKMLKARQMKRAILFALVPILIIMVLVAVLLLGVAPLVQQGTSSVAGMVQP